MADQFFTSTLPKTAAPLTKSRFFVFCFYLF